MNLLHTAERAASEAVTIGATFLDDPKIISANEKDIKTLADAKMNDAIIEQLAITGISILSEEIEHDRAEIPERCWVVDPLDGTFNFSRKYSCAAVSICLWENGTPVLGVVKDIFTGHTYSFSADQPSQLQNKNIRVSDTDEISRAVLATGFPSGANYETENLMPFIVNVQKFKKIRAIGAASMMLAHVANGVFDVYYEKDIYLWDVAAGIGLVKHAGGNFFIRRNGSTDKYEVLASNAALFDAAKKMLIGQ
jgi:myo-inositol-1(or 4)-monophosphatase